jgi:Neuraminidase (sialidase)
MVEYLHEVHDQVKYAITKLNVKYKTLVDIHHIKVTFEVRDIVWVMLTHDWFL